MYKRHYTPSIVKQHTGPGTTHSIYHFENGYGASVIPEYDHGLEQPLRILSTPDNLELAVLHYVGTGDVHDDKNWDLCYDSPITSDVLRRLTQDEVNQLLDQIAAL
jgi:hypothetical protein